MISTTQSNLEQEAPLGGLHSLVPSGGVVFIPYSRKGELHENHYCISIIGG